MIVQLAFVFLAGLLAAGGDKSPKPPPKSKDDADDDADDADDADDDARQLSF